MWFGLTASLLTWSSCTSVPTGDLQATYTVQITRARGLATQRALTLKGTSDVYARQAEATGLALDAISTQEFVLNRGTQIAADLQATAAANALKNQLTTALSWPVVLTDTFADEKKGWPSGEAADEYGTSRWSFINNKFVWEAQAIQGFIWWAVPNIPLTGDFYMAIDAKKISGPEDSAYGIISRLNQEINYYAFEITQTGDFGFFRHDSSGWTTLVPWASTTAIATDTTNTLAMLALGDRFFVLVNNSLLFNYSDAILQTGQNGLLISLTNQGDQATWEFSNFELRAPQGSVIEITPTPTP